MLLRFAALAAMSMLVNGQNSSEQKRAFLFSRIDAQIAESYSSRVVEAPEIVAALQRVATRLGAGALNFRLTRGTAALYGGTYEMICAGGRVFVALELIARVKDDDELAGLLAHALAHSQAGPIAMEAPETSPTVPLQFIAWPAADGALIPASASLVVAEAERQADAAAVQMLGRAGNDASGLLRYLERAGVDTPRLDALRAEIQMIGTIASTTPLTSECDVIQALLNQVAGPARPPTLQR